MNRKGGFTLIEILVVMAVISVLMGFGIGMYTSMAKLGAAAQAKNTLIETIQAVKGSSRTWPAALVVDPDGRRVYGLEFRTVASCSFEPRTGEDVDPGEVIGLADKYGRLMEGELKPFPFGHTGGGCELRGSGVDFGNFADYDLVDGVIIDIWVFPTEVRDMMLVSKGDSYGLQLNAKSGAGGLYPEGFLKLGAAEDVKKGGGGSKFYFKVTDHSLVLNRWNRVVLDYDRTKIKIEIDSWDRGLVTRFEQEEKEQRYIVPDPGANLVVGSGGRDGIRGRVDDFKLAGIFAGDVKPFPEDVEVWVEPPPTVLDEKKRAEFRAARQRIKFSDGKLKRPEHTSDVIIVYRYQGREQPVRINVLGIITDK